jgi:hypothetical protein
MHKKQLFQIRLALLLLGALSMVSCTKEIPFDSEETSLQPIRYGLPMLVEVGMLRKEPTITA